MVNFTCPHCGKRATSPLNESDVEYVDLGNGLPDAVFPVLPPGEERHSDQRLCCDKCWNRAGEVPQLLGQPHPYDTKTHRDRLRRVDIAAADSDPSNFLAAQAAQRHKAAMKE